MAPKTPKRTTISIHEEGNKIMTELENLIQNRYTTKAFDPEKQIAPDKMSIIKSLLRLAPSSTNSQPWHFIIVSSETGKKSWLKLPKEIIS